MRSMRGTLSAVLITLFITAAHAQQWAQQSSGSSLPLYGVTFANSRCGWAVGGSNPAIVFHTTSGGSVWDSQSVATPFSGPAYAAACTDTLKAWLAGGNFVTFATIQHTTDGGNTWTAQTSGTGSTTKSMVFVDSLNGWAAGGGTTTGSILHTTNGGTSWDTQLSGAAHTFIGLDFSNGHSGWAVGRGGEIYHTGDAGTTWDTQTSGITTDLFDVAFRDSLSGWAVGTQGAILSTADGGQNWSAQNSGTGASIWSVAVAGTEIWAVGDSGIILHSINDGENWTPQSSGVTSLLTAVAFPTPWSGWAVGQNGVILHYTGDSTHTNTPPGAFDRLLPMDHDTLVVGAETGDSVRFAWSTSVDADGDTVTYVLHLDSVHVVPDTYVTSDTSLFVHFPAPVFHLDEILTVHWSVTATDGRDSTGASNHAGQFYLDDQWLSADLSPAALAREYSLRSYPNPFNPSTTLTFGVPKTSNISLEVFDILGRKKQTLLSGMMPAGEHSVMWNCPSCPSGMYFVRVQAGGQTMQRKMLLLK